MTGPPVWFVVVSGLFFPIMTGLVLAGVIGIFRMAAAFTTFRTTVELKLEHNERQHIEIGDRIERCRRDLNEHAEEEMGEIREALRISRVEGDDA